MAAKGQYKAYVPPTHLCVEGNNGGSYIQIDALEDKPDWVRLEVGETCIRTVSTEISVVALAMLLTRCKDIGFRKLIDDYDEHSDDYPEWLEQLLPKA